jgi:hypothetical protein
MILPTVANVFRRLVHDMQFFCNNQSANKLKSKDAVQVARYGMEDHNPFYIRIRSYKIRKLCLVN